MTVLQATTSLSNVGVPPSSGSSVVVVVVVVVVAVVVVVVVVVLVVVVVGVVVVGKHALRQQPPTPMYPGSHVSVSQPSPVYFPFN